MFLLHFPTLKCPLSFASVVVSSTAISVLSQHYVWVPAAQLILQISELLVKPIQVELLNKQARNGVPPIFLYAKMQG